MNHMFLFFRPQRHRGTQSFKFFVFGKIPLCPSVSLWLKKLALSVLIFFSINSLCSQSVLSSKNRIESEFKLAVPEGQEDELWAFLQSSFSAENLRAQNPGLSSSAETEFFIDQYFDDGHETLLAQKAGARFRQRFLGDSLMKALVQLKLPGVDTTGVARQEVKFSVYEKIKRGDRQAMHPFWKHIKPKDRADIDRALAPLGTRGGDLRPALKLEQLRRRVYISENNSALMTITLDRVSSAYFPYPAFTEMELELNEIRYTEGDFEERKRLENFNAAVKEKIMSAFPGLRQDQTPKYNKMHARTSRNWLAKIAGNFSYIILGGVVCGALFLFGRSELGY